jgi:hypothetical protein
MADLSQLLNISKQYGGNLGMTQAGMPVMSGILSALSGGFSDQSQFDLARGANPILDQLASAGAVGFRKDPESGQDRWFFDQSKVGDILPKDPFGGYGGAERNAVGETVVGAMNAGAPIGHVTTGAGGRPMIDVGSFQSKQGGALVGNPNAITWDPNYGWVTPPGNVQMYAKTDFMDQFMSTILPGLIAGGLGAGFGSLAGLGSLASGAIGAGRQYAFGQNPSPTVGIGPLLSWLRSLGGG